MRWERLFADLEAQADDLALSERDALVEELRDSDWAQTSWRELLGGHVALQVQGLGLVEGRVELVNERLVHVRASHADVVVAVGAVASVLAHERRADPLSRVGDRLGWRIVLRALRDEDERVRLVRPDGATHDGVVVVVGQDFVTVRDDIGREQAVPFAAIAALVNRR